MRRKLFKLLQIFLAKYLFSPLLVLQLSMRCKEVLGQKQRKRNRSEAKKEEARRQEMEAIKERGEQLAMEVQLMKQKISEIERQFSKWTRPGFRVFGTVQAAAQPAGTQQPTAA